MNDFEWKIQQIYEGIPRGVLDRRAAGAFLRPHDAIWPQAENQFTRFADSIYEELPSPLMQRQFLSVCLASYLLATEKAPEIVPSWVQNKCDISDLLGFDQSLETLVEWQWGRAAIPVVDDINNGLDDRIIYALVAFSQGESHPLYPKWIDKCLKPEAIESVKIAADLVANRHAASGFFFWPLINPDKHINGMSLGLPVYLSFLSIAKGVAIPALLATGALDRHGSLKEVKGLKEKLDLAFRKEFRGFIYPKDGFLPFEAMRQFEPQGVTTLEEAEKVWGLGQTQDLTRLRKILKPITFGHEIHHLAQDFTGREWLIKEIDEWAATHDGRKVFWLTGEPGIGKTALSAWISGNRWYIAASHFCDFRSEEKRNPVKLVCSLAYHLASSLPEFAVRLNSLPYEQYIQEYNEAYTLFEKLIIEPLSEEVTPPEHAVIVLIDALDEASINSRNEIAILLSRLADKTPSWLRFLVTSRPEPEITSPFYCITPREISSSAKENHDDIAAYLAKRISGISTSHIQAILERSVGSFLYVYYVCNEIDAGFLKLDRIDESPRGMSGAYQDFFDRQSGKDASSFRKQVGPMLRLIIAACEPLQLGLLRNILKIDDREELYELLDRLGSLFPRSGDDDDATITPWHGSLKDWLTVRERSGPYWIDVLQGHKLLAEHGWQKFQQGADALTPYFLAWLPFHLMQCGRKDDAVRVLKDFDFMMLRAGWKQSNQNALERMLVDYREVRHEALTVEASFFRGNSNILRRGDAEWPAFKILLQLASEHADKSPLTLRAKKFFEQGKCNWPWIKSVQGIDYPQLIQCTTLEGHTGRVRGSIVLPDNRIVSWSDDQTLIIWDQDGRRFSTLKGHSSDINKVFCLKDGLFSCSRDEWILWDYDGNILKVTPAIKYLTPLIKLSEDQLLWSNVNDMYITGLDTHVLLEGHEGLIGGALLIPRNRILSWAYDEDTLRIWDFDGNCLQVIEGLEGEVSEAILLNDGSILAWSQDGNIRIWDENGCGVQSFDWHDWGIASVMPWQDCGFIAVNFQGMGRLWRKGNSLIELEYIDSPLVVLPSKRILCSLDQDLLLINEDGSITDTLDCNGVGMVGAGILDDGRILGIHNDHTLRIWDNDLENRYSFGYDSELSGVYLKILPDKEFLTLKENDIEIRDKDWNIKSLLRGHTGEVSDAVCLSNGHIISCAKDNTFRIWDKKGRFIKSIDTNSILENASSAASSILACSKTWKNSLIISEEKIYFWVNANSPFLYHDKSQSNNNMLYVCNLCENHGVFEEILQHDLIHLEHWAIIDKIHGQLFAKNIEANDWIGRLKLYSEKYVRITLNGYYITNYDKVLRIWNERGEPISEILTEHYEITDFLLLPDDRILSCSRDNVMRIWSHDGACLKVLAGHADSINGVMLLPNENILSWSDDKTLRIWNQNGETQKILYGHPSGVNGAYILPKGHILSWSSCNLRIWDNDGTFLWENGKYNPDLPYVTSLDWPSLETSYSETTIQAENFTAIIKVCGNNGMKLRWEGISNLEAEHIFPDGRVILSQNNRKFIPLQVFIGNNEESIAQLEQLVGRGGMLKGKVGDKSNAILAGC